MKKNLRKILKGYDIFILKILESKLNFNQTIAFCDKLTIFCIFSNEYKTIFYDLELESNILTKMIFKIKNKSGIS